MKLLRVSVSRKGFALPKGVDTRRIESIQLSLVQAEIFFDQHGNAKVMEKSMYSTQMLSSASASMGYWEATDEEIDILRRSGLPLADWRNLSVADIAKQYPDWAPEIQEEN
jgi:hypothetical protein